MRNLNKDIETRDKIIYGKYKPSRYKFGGTQSFRGMMVDTLKTLIDQNFADPEECQNDSPTISEFYDFMERYPEYTAHGYTVSDTRDDYRVSIEGVEKGSPASIYDELQDYMALFAGADEFNEYTMWCWFD